MKTLLVTILVIAGSGVVQSQQNPMPPITLPSQPGAPRNGTPPFGRDSLPPDDPMAAKVQEQQARSRNGERQKRLVADTDKLVNLVNELKEQVDRPGEPASPADVEKKADEIEKLAKSVKDKMKG